MFSNFKGNKFFRYSLSAVNASILSQTFFYPFDVLRARFQSHDGRDKNLVPKYKDALSAFKKVYKDEGFKGFYRGFYTTTLTVAMTRMIFITLFEMRKSHYRAKALKISSQNKSQNECSF